MNGWVPLAKSLVCELPKDRPYTRLEALFSLTVDYDEGRSATVQGYSKLWNWSRGKVDRFLEDVGAEIVYQNDTSVMQNQRGQIVIHNSDRSRADSGQIKMIDSKWLHSKATRYRADTEQTTSRSRGTTTEPNPSPVYYGEDGIEYSLQDFFERLWAHYPKRDGKKQALKHFQASVKTQQDMHDIKLALFHYCQDVDGRDPQFIKNGSTWFNNWRDWIPEESNAQQCEYI
ncbi:hypothetical protein GURASL_30290 [Geotalea uraniireducens]|uniref:Uncharacterized protein n=1 Tax=Geotalea uraniireducens TaxID=351604 RepID=A0ABM8ENT2_9BACT|nr:hypothetical protein [Geotalea uraniireducens]BDV44106.1 hypothetical protein GURASL_30290 [Geotalea uraniireducens]